MAPLTWRNVDAPNFGASNQLLVQSGETLDRAFNSAGKTMDRFQDSRQKSASAQLMASVMGMSDPAQVQAALAGVDPRMLTPEALNFATNQPIKAAELAQAKASTSGTILNNDQKAFSLDRDRYQYGREQKNDVETDRIKAEKAALGPLLADIETRARSGDLAGAQEEYRKLAPRISSIGGDPSQGIRGLTSALNDGRAQQENDQKFKTWQETTGNATTSDQLIDRLTQEQGMTKELAAQRVRDLAGKVDPKVIESTLDRIGKTTIWDGNTTSQDYNTFGLSNANSNQTDTSWAKGVDGFRGAGLVSLIDKTEGGGAYNTLYGNVQKNGPFAGVDVTKMTLGQVLDFSSRSGPYGAYQQAKGIAAAPVGRFQVINSTLRSAAKELNLPMDATFDENTQNRIFEHLAARRLNKPLTQEGKRAELRAEWEGFKNVSNVALDEAIKQFETGKPGALNNLARGGLMPNIPMGDGMNGATAPIGTDFASLTAEDDAALGRTRDAVNEGEKAIAEAARSNTIAENDLATQAEAKPPEQRTPEEQAAIDRKKAITDKVGEEPAPTIDLAQTTAAPGTEQAVNAATNNNASADADRVMREVLGRDLVKVDTNATEGQQRTQTRARNGQIDDAVTATINEYAQKPETFQAIEQGGPQRQVITDTISTLRSSEAQDYFRQNPERIADLKSNPVSMAERLIKEARPAEVPAQAPVQTEGQSAQVVQGNGPEQVLGDVVTRNQLAQSDPTPADRMGEIDRLSSDPKKAVAYLKSTITADRVYDLFGSIYNAASDPDQANKDVPTVTAETSKRLGENPDQTAQRRSVVQMLSSRVSPAIANAIYDASFVDDSGIFPWSDYSSDFSMDKANEILKNIENAGGVARVLALPAAREETIKRVNDIEKRYDNVKADLDKRILKARDNQEKAALENQKKTLDASFVRLIKKESANPSLTVNSRNR